MSQPPVQILKPSRIVLVLAILLVSTTLAARHFSKPAKVDLEIAATSSRSIADLEDRTRRAPEDAGAWRRLGLARYDARDFAGAAHAYEKATELAPNDAGLWSALGEAHVMASPRDPMPSAASAAFDRALALDARDPRARYFDAVRLDLAGDHHAAIGKWFALLADTPADAPWHDDLVRTIEQVGKINAISVHDRLAAITARSGTARSSSLPLAAQAIPGPTKAELSAASALHPDEQQAMAEAMVNRLDERLKSDPANLEGWVMLMRSRVTLGQTDKANRALAQALAANPARADYLRQQASLLGLR